MADYHRYEEIDPEFEKNADNAPWADIPRNNNLPNILWHFRCVDIYGSATRENDDGSGGKGKIVAVLEILAPEDFKGRTHIENFIVGTDMDKKAADARLWLSGASFGATNLAKLVDHIEGKTWRDVLNKEFLAFTNVNGNFTNMDFENLYKKGQAAPGTPSPSRRGRLREGSSPTQKYFAPPPAEAPCPSCHKVFPSGVIIEHIRLCKGEDEGIPF